jgi:hypothetical protein
MPFYLVLTFRTLHFLFMAVWIGAAMMMPGDVKRSFAEGVPSTPELQTLRARIRLGSTVAIVGGWGTVLSGLGLIFGVGGFAAVPKAIHIALLLAIALIALGALGLGRTWAQLQKELGDEGGGALNEEAQRLLDRYRAASMIFKTIWTLILILMVFRNVLA